MTRHNHFSIHRAISYAVIAFGLSACTFKAENASIGPQGKLPQTAPVTVKVYIDPYEGLYASKGTAYRSTVRHSYYFSEIVENGQPRGNSRIWGDASPATQRAAINAIVSAANNAGMTNEQVAMVLAIAYIESGFNPDAAAGTTSAHGLGQFIRKTGEAYGLTDANRWDIDVQARALVAHTLDNYMEAERLGLGPEYIYARHHDGSLENRYGGLDLARTRVLPLARKFSELIH